MGFPGRPRNHEAIADDISWAIIQGDTKKAKQLIKISEIDILDGDLSTPLINSSVSNLLNLSKWLIKKGANVNAQDRKGFSSLHFAAENGNLEIVKLVISNGANVNILNSFGNNPLWTACHFASLKSATESNLKIVWTLLESGANPNQANNYNKTPQDIAERNKKIKETFNKFT